MCSVRKISNCSASRRMLRRQSSSEKPSAGNKKQQKKTTTVAVANEDVTGIVPSSENWDTEDESLVGGADGSKDDAQMVGVAVNQ